MLSISELEGNCFLYRLHPPAIYIHERVAKNMEYRAGVDRVIEALESPVVPVEFGDGDIPDMILSQGILKNRQAMGTLEQVSDPILLFDTFRFDGRNAVASRKRHLIGRGVPPNLCRNSLLGTGAFHWANYNLEGDPHRQDKVCRPCWRIHLQEGCVHQCKYCSFGGLLVCMMNVQEYCGYLGQIISRHPWQKTYLLDDDGDPPCLEPELGTLGTLIEYFGKQQERYLVIHTKTWNTEWMTSLRHQGNTIVLWSLSGRTQSRELEPATGTFEERVEAARIAEEAGYTVRFKFKPIIPVKNWREEADEAVELLFQKTHPDVISLCCFMWMDVDEMKRRLPQEMLDPWALTAAEEDREEMEGTRAKPFPQRIRKEIYQHYVKAIRKHDPKIPVTLSTENFRMWAEMGRELGYSATNYPCGCGPQTVPGQGKLKCHPFRVAVRNDDGIPGVIG